MNILPHMTKKNFEQESLKWHVHSTGQVCQVHLEK